MEGLRQRSRMGETPQHARLQRCGNCFQHQQRDSATPTVLTHPLTVVEPPKVVEEDALGKSYDRRLLRRLLGYLKPYWRVVALSVACLLTLSVLQIAGPLLTRQAIDVYLTPPDLPVAD